MQTLSIPTYLPTQTPEIKEAVSESRIDTAIKKIKSILSLSDLALENRIFYISNSGESESQGLEPDTALRPDDGLKALKHKLRVGDTLRFRRGEIFMADGFYKILKKKNVFIEAYGMGADPILKTQDEFVEITSTTWF